MILIDKQTSNAEILLTVGVVNNATLKVIYPFDGSVTDILLGTDVSGYPERYNKYILPISMFSALQPGLYLYEVTNPDVIETGYMRIVDTEVAPISAPDSNSPYIVYEA